MEKFIELMYSYTAHKMQSVTCGGWQPHLSPVSIAPLFRAYFCFVTGKQPPDIAVMAGPDNAAYQ